MTIVTRRTLLVPYTEAFELDFIMLNCCVKNRAHMDGHKTVAASKQLFQQVLHNPSLHAMAVLDNYNREFMGHVYVEVDHSVAELGFIFDKSYWGQGLATEALKAFFPKVCQRLGLERVTAKVNVGHEPSIVILRELGFENKGENEGILSPYYEFEWLSEDDIVVDDTVIASDAAAN